MGCYCGFQKCCQGLFGTWVCCPAWEPYQHSQELCPCVGFVSSCQLDLAQSQSVCFHSPLTTSSHFQEVGFNKTKLHPYEEGFGKGELMFPGEYSSWNSVSGLSLFNGVGWQDMSAARGKYSKCRAVLSSYFQKPNLYSFVLVGLPRWCDDDELHCLICHVGIG